MKRRDLLKLGTGLGGAWPAARAAASPPVVGILHGASASAFAPLLEALLQGLSDNGYVQGRNVQLEYRWADGDPARLPQLAAELAQRRVAVIVAASGIASALAAKQATRTIPVVFCMGADPVENGLVASLSRPGGNVTGVFLMEASLQVKRMELLRQLAPAARHIAALVNPANPQAQAQWTDIRAAAQTVGLSIERHDAGHDAALEQAFAAIEASPAHALTVIADSFFTSRRERIVGFAARHKLPAVFYLREYVTQGGLMSYGVSLGRLYHQTGGYVAKILSGARPQTLPVAAPTRFDLVINPKTAAALGLQVPVALLARADELVQ